MEKRKIKNGGNKKEVGREIEKEADKEPEIIKSANPEEIRKAQKNQLKLILLIMVGVFIVVLTAFWIINESMSFQYGGIPFQKTTMGKILFYTAHVVGKGITGNTVNMYINMRKDPRKLGDIPVPSNIILKNPVYISIEPNVQCSDAYISLVNLGLFLGEMGFTTKDAVVNLSFAEGANKTYIDCENANSTVIMIQPGDITTIKRVHEDCYEIYFKNCEILEATERFEIGYLAGLGGNKIYEYS